MSFWACARSCCSAVEPDGAEVLAALDPEPAVEGAAVAGAVAGEVAAVDGPGLLPHPASSHAAAMTGTSVTVCHLGVLALRLSRKLQWDPSKEQFVGDRDANHWLSREMRKPWTYESI